MSEKTSDGGPAFPTDGFKYDQKDLGRTGMTLRDWFAGEAIGECFSQAITLAPSPENIDTYANRAAFWAYRLAEAMLVERGRG